MTGAEATPMPAELLYGVLADESEKVRWALADIPWADLRPELAPPALRALVREMAFSEHATYSATQKFMQTFANDVDFTQWLAVWFYEETRHPHVLATWLERLGEPVESDFVGRGRVSTPFMKSLTGTLVTNIISEVTAAHAYHTMAVTAREPVLAAIARRISGDEARHGSAFFRYADRRIAEARDPDRERLDALKVLHFWLNESGQVTHPINQMIERLRALGDGVGQVIKFDIASVNRRVTRLIGVLVGLALSRPEDVLAELTRLTTHVHAKFGAGA
jgi:ferritin